MYNIRFKSFVIYNSDLDIPRKVSRRCNIVGVTVNCIVATKSMPCFRLVIVLHAFTFFCNRSSSSNNNKTIFSFRQLSVQTSVRPSDDRLLSNCFSKVFALGMNVFHSNGADGVGGGITWRDQ